MSGETRKIYIKEGSTSVNSEASGSKSPVNEISEGEKLSKNQGKHEEKNNAIEKSENVASGSESKNYKQNVSAATKRPLEEGANGELTTSFSINDKYNTAKRIKKNEDKSNDDENRVNVTNAAVDFMERAQPGCSGASPQPSCSGASAQPECSGASPQSGSSGARAQPSCSGAGSQPGSSRASAQLSCSGAGSKPSCSGANVQTGARAQHSGCSSSLVDNTVEQVKKYIY